MSRLFDRGQLGAAALPMAFDAPRAHLALEAVWVRWRLLALAARRGDDLARLIQLLEIGEESYQLGDEAIRAVELLERRSERLRTEIDARLVASPRLPISRAARALQLPLEDRHAVAMLMVLELDPACHQAAITHRREPPGHPTLLVIEDVLSTSVRRSSLAQRALGRATTVGIAGAVDLIEQTLGVPVPLCHAEVRLRPRLRDFLLGVDALPDAISGLATTGVPPPLVELAHLTEIVATTAPLCTGSTVPWLVGAPGAGRRTVASKIASALDRPLLVVSWNELASGARVPEHVRDLALEERLTRAMIFIDWRGPWDASALRPLALLRRLADAQLMLGTDELHDEVVQMVPDLLVTPLGLPPRSERRRFLAARLATRPDHGLADAEIEALADSMALLPGQLTTLVAQCGVTPRGAGLVEVMRRRGFEQVHARLAELAHPIRNAFRLEDLVLADEERRAIEELIDAIRHFPRILDEWGLARVLPYGRGIHALFAGPPGTGKTMAASVIANTFGRELFRIDLSRLVSKYIGETEKNIGRVFAAAAGTHAVLFFDEADALFARRTEVHSHHDRFANMETGYLLQQIEQYDGVTILATNLAGSLDEAFTRRIPYRVDFRRPGADERAVMWTKLLAPPLPVDDIDIVRLAEDYELSGAQIKSAVIRASLAAVRTGDRVTEASLRVAAVFQRRLTGALVEDVGRPLGVAEPDQARAVDPSPSRRTATLSPSGRWLAVRDEDGVTVSSISAPTAGTPLRIPAIDDIAFVGSELWVAAAGVLHRFEPAGGRAVGEPARVLDGPGHFVTARGLRRPAALWRGASTVLVRTGTASRIEALALALPTDISTPALLGDGRIAFVHDGSLHTLDASGRGARLAAVGEVTSLGLANVFEGRCVVAVFRDDTGDRARLYELGGRLVRSIELPHVRAFAVADTRGAIFVATDDELVAIDLRGGDVFAREPAPWLVRILECDAAGRHTLLLGAGERSALLGV